MDDNELIDQIMDLLRDKGDGIMRADLDQVERLLARVTPDKRHEITPWIFEGLFLKVNAPGYEGDLPPVDDILDPFDEAAKFVKRKGLRLRRKHLALLGDILSRVGPELHPRIMNDVAMIIENPRYRGDIPSGSIEFDISAYA